MTDAQYLDAHERIFGAAGHHVASSALRAIDLLWDGDRRHLVPIHFHPVAPYGSYMGMADTDLATWVTLGPLIADAIGLHVMPAYWKKPQDELLLDLTNVVVHELVHRVLGMAAHESPAWAWEWQRIAGLAGFDVRIERPRQFRLAGGQGRGYGTRPGAIAGEHVPQLPRALTYGTKLSILDMVERPERRTVDPRFISTLPVTTRPRGRPRKERQEKAPETPGALLLSLPTQPEVNHG